MSKTRAQHLEEFERWAERVQPHELVVRARSQELVDQLDESPRDETDQSALPAGG